MRVAASRAHLRRDPDRLHQLFAGGARAERRSGVALYAIRTLRDVGDGDRDDLLSLRGKRAFREDLPAEGLEGGRGFRRQCGSRRGKAPS